MYWMSLYLPIIILGIASWEQVGIKCSGMRLTSVLLSKSTVQVNPENYATSLICDYKLTSGDRTLSIEIKRKRFREPYITIATFYELETLPATYTRDGLDLKGRTSLTSPKPTTRTAILHFISLKPSDEADYCCTLMVARPLEGNLQIKSSDIRLSFAGTEEINKSVCIGESTSLFQNIIIDSLSKTASIYRHDEDGPLALLSFSNVEYKSDKYSTKILHIGNGTIYLLAVDNTDEVKYSIRYDVGNISNWHELNLQVLVAPSAECRPDITFKNNILTASLNPDKCGKPTVSVSWLENPDTINEGKTIATMIPERKPRIYHACIEGPAIGCLKNLKLSDYCSAFAINESNFPSEAFESSLQCDGYVATIVLQCIVMTLVLSDLFIHIYEVLHKRKENRPVMESCIDTADTLVISATGPTEEDVTGIHLTDMADPSNSERTRPETTIDLHERKRGRKTEPVKRAGPDPVLPREENTDKTPTNISEHTVPSPSPRTDNKEERMYQVHPTYPSRHQTGGDGYTPMESIHKNVPT